MSDMDYKELEDDAPPEFERAGLKPRPRDEPAPEPDEDRPDSDDE
jgi:hypothetical protein